MHDWIAFEALQMAKKDGANVKWLTDNLGTSLYATEVPDLGVIPSVTRSLHPVGQYHDQGSCRCIYFDAQGHVTNNRMAVRAQEEFDKAKSVLANHNPRLAAFYAGAMAHYLGDFSQFMHLMGIGHGRNAPKSHWGREDDTAHGAYESVVDKKFNCHESLVLESFVKKESIAGTTASGVALTIAKFTETGNGDIDVGHMYTSWLKLRSQRKSSPSSWPRDFMDQTGHNINESING